jgi:hypothetical protein
VVVDASVVVVVSGRVVVAVVAVVVVVDEVVAGVAAQADTKVTDERVAARSLMLNVLHTVHETLPAVRPLRTSACRPSFLISVPLRLECSDRLWRCDDNPTGWILCPRCAGNTPHRE